MHPAARFDDNLISALNFTAAAFPQAAVTQRFQKESYPVKRVEKKRIPPWRQLLMAYEVVLNVIVESIKIAIRIVSRINVHTRYGVRGGYLADTLTRGRQREHH